ncbi:hypothetical protein [Autumnicola musiva]|uniref:Uncharacterized protein n=1 Tax=Autumnicola musiva TaxID=3075589 RepID=A0ABU3D449_9FLAO|nr:hypothetical protein [Zunongwangia sp. F117]MDT0676298.1 hypothetical protein [Zunongwangia sp. F117]
MKTKLLGFIICSAFFWSCKEKKEEQKETNQTSPVIVEENESIPQKQCFLYAQNNDTINLGLEITGDQVTGYLMYHLAEKDKNNGQIVGEMRGDTLFAEYYFNSEGKESVRDVVFLKEKTSITEGYAEMKETDGKVTFVNPSAVKFDENFRLKRTNCGVN